MGLELLQAPEAVRRQGQESYDDSIVMLTVASIVMFAAYHGLNLRFFDDLAARVRRIESPTPVWFLFLAGMLTGLSRDGDLCPFQSLGIL